MKLLVFASVLLFINSANTLKCFICSGTETSDCAMAKNSSMSIQPCIIQQPEDTHDKVKHILRNATIPADMQLACFRFALHGFEPNLMGRSCGMVPKKEEPCKFLMKYKVFKDCKACKTDLCNRDTKVVHK